jgi:hypothetical protein
MTPWARSALAHQLLENLNSTIPTLLRFPSRGDFREVGVQNWQIWTDFLQFLSEQMVFKKLWSTSMESWSHQLRIDTKMSPQLGFSFFFHLASTHLWSMVKIGVWDSHWHSAYYFYLIIPIQKRPSTSLHCFHTEFPGPVFWLEMNVSFIMAQYCVHRLNNFILM